MMDIEDTDGVRYGPLGREHYDMAAFFEGRPFKRVIEMMAGRMAEAMAARIPTCGACHRALGPANEACEKVGSVVVACDFCYGPSPLRGEGCNCWVRDRPAEERFSIRYGAHDVQCPMWAPSLDPVDAANDAELRLRLDR